MIRFHGPYSTGRYSKQFSLQLPPCISADHMRGMKGAEESSGSGESMATWGLYSEPSHLLKVNSALLGCARTSNIVSYARSVCVYVCMCVSLTADALQGFGCRLSDLIDQLLACPLCSQGLTIDRQEAIINNELPVCPAAHLCRPHFCQSAANTIQSLQARLLHHFNDLLQNSQYLRGNFSIMDHVDHPLCLCLYKTVAA